MALNLVASLMAARHWSTLEAVLALRSISKQPLLLVPALAATAEVLAAVVAHGLPCIVDLG